MQDKRYILCGGTSSNDSRDQSRDLILQLSGKEGPGNVKLWVEDIHERMFSNIPTEFHDLLEIAAYVYTADQAIKRGSIRDDNFGEDWQRDLHFVIPVRNPDFWKSFAVNDALRSTLGFLSDDNYVFEFVRLEKDRTIQEYLEFNDTQQFFGTPDQVVMFSGGLDSLAGAIDEIINQKHRVVLVTHKPTPKRNTLFRTLNEKLRDKAGDYIPFHISVRANKSKGLNHEYTQRSRSFLFMAIGATIARMLGKKSVRFYENGVISLNLPVSAQVVGGRATRTTHPRAMKGFQDIVSLVAGETFTIENPFIWKTKAEVVEVITKAGCQDLIGHSMTCTHTWETDNQFTHCGTCSQCIDRRFAVIAAKADQFDPLSQYKVDIFTQSRGKDEDKIMVASYLERANQVKRLGDVAQFIARYSEVAGVVRYLDGQPAQVADRIFGLYKRHANEVNQALDEMGQRYFPLLRERTVPGDCIIRTATDPASAILVPATAIPEPEYYFRKRGNTWEARFRGKNRVVITNSDKGCEYINILLSKPNHDFEASDLVFASTFDATHLETGGLDLDEIAEGFTVTDGVPLGDAGEILDTRARRELKQRGRDLLDLIHDALELGNAEQAELLRAEAIEINKALEEGIGLGGRPRKAKDDRKRIRDSFSAAVKRALKRISEFDQPLADHLSASIKLGSVVSYRPADTVEWDVRQIVNEAEPKPAVLAESPA